MKNRADKNQTLQQKPFDETLYDKVLITSFDKRIRNIMRASNVKELRQMLDYNKCVEFAKF